MGMDALLDWKKQRAKQGIVSSLNPCLCGRELFGNVSGIPGTLMDVTSTELAAETHSMN